MANNNRFASAQAIKKILINIARCRVSKILFILIKKIYSFTLVGKFLFCSSEGNVMSFTCAFDWCRSILCRCSIPCLLLLSFELSKCATNHPYYFLSYFYRQNWKYRHISTKSTGNRWIFRIRWQCHSVWQHLLSANQPKKYTYTQNIIVGCF